MLLKGIVAQYRKEDESARRTVDAMLILRLKNSLFNLKK